MKAQITLIALLTLFATGSCTIEKQLYSNGFHVEFHKRVHKADDSHTGQPKDEIQEIESVKIPSDSIIDAPAIQQKEEETVPAGANEQIIPTSKSVSRKSKIKLAVNPIQTRVSIQIHFSESLMSKSLKKNQLKYSVNKSRGVDWGEVLDWVLIVGGIIGAIFLLAAMPGVSFAQALLIVLVVILAIVLLALLISNALGDFEWFWSGR